jgi:hypothetical protein
MSLEQPTPEELSAIEAEKAERVIEAAHKEVALGRVEAEKPDAAEKAKEARLLAGTPVGFAKSVLGMTLYWWQALVLTWFENTFELVKASLCTPNGAGKSAFVDAILALWWITVHPQGIVVITTKDSKQLDNQLWPAIEKHKQKFPGYDFIERMVRNGKGGFIIGFTTDDPGRAEGWHKLDDICGPLLIIGDEAKSIADAIHMALDRCTYNAKLLTSSPGLTEGIFWRSQREDQAAPPIGYHHLKVGLTDCPHIPQSRIDNILAEYGPDHWFTRSTLHGEFTDVDSDTLFVIPKDVVREAMGMDGSVGLSDYSSRTVFCRRKSKPTPAAWGFRFWPGLTNSVGRLLGSITRVRRPTASDIRTVGQRNGTKRRSICAA